MAGFVKIRELLLTAKSPFLVSLLCDHRISSILLVSGSKKTFSCMLPKPEGEAPAYGDDVDGGSGEHTYRRSNPKGDEAVLPTQQKKNNNIVLIKCTPRSQNTVIHGYSLGTCNISEKETH